MNRLTRRFVWLLLITVSIINSVSAQENTGKTPKKDAFHPDFKAVFWYQQSAEAQALYIQAYNIATYRLSEIKAEPHTKKLAVVLDLDETVMDNSPYQAAVAANRVTYPKGWSEWVSLEEANILPGAKEFLLKAVELGFEPFYITNRSDAEKAATISNLKKKGIPFADEQHVITKSKTSDKTERRNVVSETHDIVLLIGDNLGDFDEVFQKKTNTIRKSEVEKFRNEFGKRFIIIPNPMYGEWEGASFGFDYKKSLIQKVQEQKDSLRIATW